MAGKSGSMSREFLHWLAIIWLGLVGTAFAQEPPAAPPATPAKPVPGPDLSSLQQQIFRDYERFEKSLFDVAEQARRKDPERAELLYRARSQSQEQNILAEMQTIAELLRSQSPTGAAATPQYGPAVDREQELLGRLELVLKLLQSLDERERIAGEIARIQDLLKDTNHLIARQKDVRADTQRSKESAQPKKAQQRVSDEARKLSDKIEQQEQERRREQQGQGQSEKKPDSPGDKTGKSADQESESGDQKSGKKKPGQPESPSGDQQKNSKSQEPQTPGDQPPQPGGKPSSPQAAPQQKSQAQPPAPGSQETPGREELEQARREMQQAIEQLEQDSREKAVDEQDAAVARLEQMKAQLEEILRQLREDEKESYLALLEARFQNMLKRQQQINSETVRLDAIAPADRAQQNYASQTDKTRKEQEDNALDAEKALHLLREEGSSVAFPEAVEQMHQNMRLVVSWLARQDTGRTTQLVERQIAETLEEMIAAFRKEMEKKQEQQQGPPGQQGPPQDPSLVDQLAELKMIRSLQYKINQLTQQIGTELDASNPDNTGRVQLIRDLQARQERIQRATYDLSVGRNK